MTRPGLHQPHVDYTRLEQQIAAETRSGNAHRARQLTRADAEELAAASDARLAALKAKLPQKGPR